MRRACLLLVFLAGFVEPGSTGSTPCPPGNFVDTSGGASATCTPCEVGTFSAREDSPACTPCAAGTFASDTGLPACVDCPRETFQNDVGQRECKACPGAPVRSTTCANEGCTYENTAMAHEGVLEGRNNDNGVCVVPTCTSGIVSTPLCGFCLANDGQVEAGAALDAEWADNVCVASTCHNSKMQPVTVDDAACGCRDEDGFVYKEGDALVPVNRPPDNDPAGPLSCVVPTCTQGHFQDASCGFCLRAGEQVQQGPVGDPFQAPGGTCVQLVCDQDVIRQDASDADPCGCPAGHVVDPASSDQSCVACEAGTYLKSAECTRCPPGRFGSDAGQDSCEFCPADSFQDHHGQRSCKPCPGAYMAATSCPQGCTYNTVAGPVTMAHLQELEGRNDDSGVCVVPKCYDGEVELITCDYCLTSHGEPVDNEGTVGPMWSGDECIEWSCLRGQLQRVTAGDTCGCRPGTFVKGDVCEACPVGSYSSRPNSEACSPCEAGMFSAVLGQSSCEACAAGTFQASTGQSSCDSCPGAPVAATSCSQGCRAGDGTVHSVGTTLEARQKEGVCVISTCTSSGEFTDALCGYCLTEDGPVDEGTPYGEALRTGAGLCLQPFCRASAIVKVPAPGQCGIPCVHGDVTFQEGETLEPELTSTRVCVVPTCEADGKLSLLPCEFCLERVAGQVAPVRVDLGPLGPPFQNSEGVCVQRSCQFGEIMEEPTTGSDTCGNDMGCVFEGETMSPGQQLPPRLNPNNMCYQPTCTNGEVTPVPCGFCLEGDRTYNPGDHVGKPFTLRDECLQRICRGSGIVSIPSTGCDTQCTVGGQVLNELETLDPVLLEGVCILPTCRGGVIHRPPCGFCLVDGDRQANGFTLPFMVTLLDQCVVTTCKGSSMIDVPCDFCIRNDERHPAGTSFAQIAGAGVCVEEICRLGAWRPVSPANCGHLRCIAADGTAHEPGTTLDARLDGERCVVPTCRNGQFMDVVADDSTTCGNPNQCEAGASKPIRVVDGVCVEPTCTDNGEWELVQTTGCDCRRDGATFSTGRTIAVPNSDPCIVHVCKDGVFVEEDCAHCTWEQNNFEEGSTLEPRYDAIGVCVQPVCRRDGLFHPRPVDPLLCGWCVKDDVRYRNSFSFPPHRDVVGRCFVTVCQDGNWERESSDDCPPPVCMLGRETYQEGATQDPFMREGKCVQPVCEAGQWVDHDSTDCDVLPAACDLVTDEGTVSRPHGTVQPPVLRDGECVQDVCRDGDWVAQTSRHCGCRHNGVLHPVGASLVHSVGDACRLRTCSEDSWPQWAVTPCCSDSGVHYQEGDELEPTRTGAGVCTVQTCTNGAWASRPAPELCPILQGCRANGEFFLHGQSQAPHPDSAGCVVLTCNNGRWEVTRVVDCVIPGCMHDDRRYALGDSLEPFVNGLGVCVARTCRPTGWQEHPVTAGCNQGCRRGNQLFPEGTALRPERDATGICTVTTCTSGQWKAARSDDCPPVCTLDDGTMFDEGDTIGPRRNPNGVCILITCTDGGFETTRALNCPPLPDVCSWNSRDRVRTCATCADKGDECYFCADGSCSSDRGDSAFQGCCKEEPASGLVADAGCFFTQFDGSNTCPIDEEPEPVDECNFDADDNERTCEACTDKGRRCHFCGDGTCKSFQSADFGTCCGAPGEGARTCGWTSRLGVRQCPVEEPEPEDPVDPVDPCNFVPSDADATCGTCTAKGKDCHYCRGDNTCRQSGLESFGDCCARGRCAWPLVDQEMPNTCRDTTTLNIIFNIDVDNFDALSNSDLIEEIADVLHESGVRISVVATRANSGQTVEVTLQFEADDLGTSDHPSSSELASAFTAEVAAGRVGNGMMLQAVESEPVRTIRCPDGSFQMGCPVSSGPPDSTDPPSPPKISPANALRVSLATLSLLGVVLALL
mmetsp:Transcript_23556/g.26151  ORF Transcript_23556/g.26151 Transcript_23556/m.26151 type:complete len:1896 (+) Transcript_23556:42-5729(+)